MNRKGMQLTINKTQNFACFVDSTENMQTYFVHVFNMKNSIGFLSPRCIQWSVFGDLNKALKLNYEIKQLE